VVQANLGIEFHHTAGTNEQIFVYLDDAFGSCPNSEGWVCYVWFFDEAAGTYPRTAFVQKPFDILSAGNYTFYLNAFAASPIDQFGYWSNLVAVFYPS